jgi:hypothetical protein
MLLFDLSLKISDATKRFLAKDEVKEALEIIQQKEGYKIANNLAPIQENGRKIYWRIADANAIKRILWPL